MILRLKRTAKIVFGAETQAEVDETVRWLRHLIRIKTKAFRYFKIEGRWHIDTDTIGVMRPEREYKRRVG